MYMMVSPNDNHTTRFLCNTCFSLTMIGLSDLLSSLHCTAGDGSGGGLVRGLPRDNQTTRFLRTTLFSIGTMMGLSDLIC